jgi:hypothetical protein
MTLTVDSGSVSVSLQTLEKIKNVELAGFYCYLSCLRTEDKEKVFTFFESQLCINRTDCNRFLSSLAGLGLLSPEAESWIVKSGEDFLSNPLTTQVSMPRINTVHTVNVSQGYSEASRDQSATGSRQEATRLPVQLNNKKTFANTKEDHPTETVSGDQKKEEKILLLKEEHFSENSPLQGIKEIIISWWNNHKSGKKTHAAWKIQKAEFKKIYLDADVNKDIDALRLAVEQGISSSQNGKQWQGIQYARWVAYNKKFWLQYKSSKDSCNGSSQHCARGSGEHWSGVGSQPRTGPWIGRIELPARK